MSPVLDATKIQDESELTREQEEQEQQEATGETPPEIAFDPTRSITLALPPECETAVTLLVQRGSDNFYRPGFHIVRSYEASPHEQAGEDLPVTDPAADEGFTIFGEAAMSAAEMAAEWLQFNSDDEDEKAQAALTWLDDWVGALDPVALAESIFDEEIAICNPCTGTGTFFTPPEVLSIIGNSPAEHVAPPAVTEDAQQHYDDRKHKLEEQLGKLSIEQVRLKAAVTCNRKAMNTITGELEDHLARGVVRLPLFDRTMPEELRIPTINPDGQPIAVDPAVPAPANEAALDESAEAWRAATIEEIGIEPKICQLLRDNNQIETLGQIADHCKDYELTDLKKIGKSKAEKIENAMDAYWRAHPLAEVAEKTEEPE